MSEKKTKPRDRFPKGVTPDPSSLAAGRYGTDSMVEIWGPEKTFEYSLKVQGVSALTLAELYPDLVPLVAATDIYEHASLQHIDPNRIRQIEAETGHDGIAINTSLGEVVAATSSPHINKLKTTADMTEPASALQLKSSLEVIAETTENLRDIILEKALEWNDVPNMDTTHLYDAAPTVAGRPFAHYAEMLQSGLTFLKFVYDTSIVGKWADTTGNHHAATMAGVDGMAIQEAFCKKLGIHHMIAPAQIPGLEYKLDVVYVLTRLGATINNLAKYIAMGRGDDVNIFQYANPKKQKGSSGMPHKDAKNGNPTAEEQAVSMFNKLAGMFATALLNTEMLYGRTLYASANGRIDFEDGFKFMDHATRNLATVAYWLEVKRDRCAERVLRSYGACTSPQVLVYLTDARFNETPLPWREAHDLVGRLATAAWNQKRQFYEVLRSDDIVAGRIPDEVLKEITDPMKFLGQSKEIVRQVYDRYHGKKTLTVGMEA